jgi:malate permease and related proteins
MTVFFILLAKIVPLYALILLGFLAGRMLDARKETVASLLIYIIAPLVIFHGVVTTPLSVATVMLPLLFFALCCVTCGLAYVTGRLVWKDTTANIFAFTGGTGNTGYFGIPVAIALFGDAALGPMALATLGFVLYECTLGIYVTARGKYSARQSIRKILLLPSIYAFLIGIAVNLAQVPLNETYHAFALNMRGSYSVLGMMLIGLGLADVRRWKPDFRFFSLTFLFKFALWPGLMALVLFIDSAFLHSYDQLTRGCMVLLSVVPLAANTVAWATELKAQPEKAAMAVLASTIFALFYIPLVAVLFL